MKITTLLVAACAFSTATIAQIKEGTIVYEKKTNMHRRITNEEMKAFMPEFSSSKHILLFNENSSLYKDMPQDEMPETDNGGGVRMIMKFGGGSSEIYKNFGDKQELKKTEIAEKDYIIVDSVKTQPWKLSNETKTILGYTCKKATMQIKQRGTMSISMFKSTDGVATDSAKNKVAPKEEEVEVVAWYTESLVSPVGPDTNSGLPGAILELDTNKGETVITAIEVKKEVSLKELKAPTKGKRITPDEHKKLVKQMMDNMQQGGGIRTMSFGN